MLSGKKILNETKNHNPPPPPPPPPLQVKWSVPMEINSNNWFTEVKSLMWKYDLPEIYGSVALVRRSIGPLVRRSISPKVR